MDSRTHAAERCHSEEESGGAQHPDRSTAAKRQKTRPTEEHDEEGGVTVQIQATASSSQAGNLRLFSDTMRELMQLTPSHLRPPVPASEAHTACFLLLARLKGEAFALVLDEKYNLLDGSGLGMGVPTSSSSSSSSERASSSFLDMKFGEKTVSHRISAWSKLQASLLECNAYTWSYAPGDSTFPSQLQRIWSAA
jgi:hypothetical protein